MLAALAQNTIIGNGAAGVQVNAVSGIPLVANSIDGNGGPGIELVNGGNHNQPAPDIGNAVIGASSIDISGSLPSPLTVGHSYHLEFFRSSSCGTGSNPQGKTFIGELDTDPYVRAVPSISRRLSHPSARGRRSPPPPATRTTARRRSRPASPPRAPIQRRAARRSPSTQTQIRSSRRATTARAQCRTAPFARRSTPPTTTALPTAMR